MYQRVYQYLKILDSKDYKYLEKFIFIGTLEGTDKDCLETIIRSEIIFRSCLIESHFRHSDISDPTWKEIRHFVWFFNIQLSACEQSNLIKKVSGLRTFVVNFMKTMSRVSMNLLGK